MSSSDLHSRPHPDELLAAYSLDTLDHGDTVHVESHLDDCAQCRQSVAEFQGAAAQLAQAVSYQQPDPVVRSRVMEAIAQAAAPPAPAWELPPPAHSVPQMSRLLLPVAALVVVALFTLAVFMNIRISNRVGALESENSTLVDLVNSVNGENSALTTQLADTEAYASYLTDELHQLQLTSYWLANPANRPLTLKPRGGGGDSRGILLVGENGHRAVLMVSGMEERASPSMYQVWLLRHGSRLWAGDVEVDDNGWGTATLQPTESVFGFDKVELTAKTVAGVAPGPDDMVLEGAIQFTTPYEMLTLQAWK